MSEIAEWSTPFAEFNGQTVLVTGGSTGIGAAVARAFGQTGARVAVHYHASREAADTVVDDIRRHGGEAIVVQADLAAEGAARGLVEEVAGQFGGLDVLINNAGSIGGRLPTLEIDSAFYRNIIDLNVTSVFMACQAAIPLFLDKGRGVIINTTSLAARMGGGPGTVPYAIAKAGVSNLTRGIAKEFAARGIRVNAVAPGFISTPLHRLTPAAMMEGFEKSIPMARLGDPQDCIGVYLFLASERLSGYITGQTIEVNGGLYMP